VSEWIDDGYCIACGENNPIGMHLKFEAVGEGIEAKYAFPREFQGYSNMAHGGMIALLLDEIMVNLPWKKYNTPVVSADIRIKLKKPIMTGEPVRARAWFVKEKSRVFIVKSEVLLEKDGTIAAEGEALCVKVDGKKTGI